MKAKWKDDSNKLYYIALVLFFFLEIVRPQDSVFPFLAPLKIPGLVSLFMVWVSLAVIKRELWWIKPVKLLVYFIAVAFVSSALSDYVNASIHIVMAILMHLLVFVIPVLGLLLTRERVSQFFFWFVLASVIVALWGITHDGRGPGSFTADENDLALYLCMALPFAIYMSFLDGISAKLKLFYRMSALLLVAGVVVSFSRGGFVGLVSVLGVMWWLSAKRIRIMISMLLISIPMSVVVLQVLPEGYVEDMQSISDEGNSTRLERFYSWGLGWDMFVANPIVGVGAGNYPREVGFYEDLRGFRPEGQKSVSWRQAHSLYFTLIPELGVVGVFTYGVMVAFLLRSMREIFNKKNQMYPDTDLYFLLARSVFVAIVAFMVSGAFLSVLYYGNFFMMVAFAALLWRNAQLELQEGRSSEKNLRSSVK